MQGNISVENLTEDSVLVGGKIYFSEKYVQTMLSREYYRGKMDGQQIHIAEVTYINRPEECSKK